MARSGSRNQYCDLLRAIQSGSKGKITDILTHGNVNLDRLDNTEQTLLFHAIVTRRFDVVVLLVEAGADIEKESFHRYVLDYYMSEHYERPLITAARLGSLDTVHYLLQLRANPNAQSRLRGHSPGSFCFDETPLHIAVEKEHVGLLKCLLEFHADVNVYDCDGELPLHKAMRCRDRHVQTQMISALCQNGSNVNLANNMTCTPLYMAAHYLREDAVYQMLEHGAHVNSCCLPQSRQLTPLHIVAQAGQPSALTIARLLLKHGALLDTPDAGQCTPLQLNLRYQASSPVASLLIYHGASVNVKDKSEERLLGTCLRSLRIDAPLLVRLFIAVGYNFQPEAEMLGVLPQIDQAEQELGEYFPVPEVRSSKLGHWLYQSLLQPLQLARSCRIVIRQAISRHTGGSSIVDGAYQLALPRSIIHYVLLHDIFKSMPDVIDLEA